MKQIFTRMLTASPWISRALGARSGLRIVYYHRLNARVEPYYFETGISPDAFERQIDHLADRFTIIPLSDAFDMAAAGKSLDGHLCITVDDGFKECHTEIFPRLDARNIKATFFLLEDCLNNQAMMWRNKVLHVQNTVSPDSLQTLISDAGHNPNEVQTLIALSNHWAMDEKEEMADKLWADAGMQPLADFLQDKQPYLTDAEVQEMLAAGQEIGLHTRSHPFCNKLTTEQQVIEEIIKPAQRMNDRFGIKMRAMAYPFGDRLPEHLEQFTLDNSDIISLMGIADTLSNGANCARWERQNLEMPFDKSMLHFYLAPWRRRLVPR